MNAKQQFRTWQIAETHAERLGTTPTQLHDTIRALLKLKNNDERLEGIHYLLDKLNKN